MEEGHFIDLVKFIRFWRTEFQLFAQFCPNLSYYHLDLCNLISNMKIKLKIIDTSESRLQKTGITLIKFLPLIMCMNIPLQNQVKGVHSIL